MPTSSGRRRRHLRVVPLARPRRDDEDGFILLESIISISLITVIMAALAVLFVTVIKVNNQQRARQTAVQIAESAVGQVRSLNATDLVTGRTTTAVAAQWSAAPTSVQTWLASMQQATSNSSSTPAVPTTATTQIVNNVSYSVNTYLGLCWLNPTTSSSACTAATSTGAIQYLRAVVSVSWTDTHCPAASSTDSTPTCVYVTSTLVSASPDPIFNLNQSPPAVPVIVNPGTQNSFAVGDTVSLQMAVQSGTGVPTYTWTVSAGSLPTGLSMNPAGLISGTISGTSGTVSTSIQVTDGFARNAASPATFSWTVLPALTIANPGPQSSVTGGPITPLTVSASGGSGTPYTWSAGTTLPPGLSLSTVNNQASISGTPTAASGTPYSVTLTVKDATNSRSATTTFLWTVTYPPIGISGASNQTDTLNNPSPGLTLTASGGDGSYTWTGASTLPAGMSLSQTGIISGTPTTIQNYPVTITVTDSHGNTRSTSFTWNVVARPTITTPAPATTSVGAYINLAIGNTCPNAPCTFSVTSGALPTGLTINNSAGTITGYVGGSAQTYNGIVVTIKDADGATASSSSFNWNVAGAPTVTTPSSQVDTTSATISRPLTTTCPLSPCTYTLKNGPSGLTISGSGVISGTIGNAAGSTFGSVTVTVTDSAGSPMTTAAFSWTITAAPTVTSPGTLTSKVGSAVNITVASTCPDSPCTYTLVSGPAGVTIINGLMSGTITGSAKTYTASVQIADKDGITASSANFSWTVGATSNIAGTWPISTAKSATPQQPFNYTCSPSGSNTQCAIKLTGAPTGIGLSATPGNTANNTTVSVLVSSGPGTVYLNGLVSSTATSGTYAVTVTIYKNPGGTGATLGTDNGNWTVA